MVFYELWNNCNYFPNFFLLVNVPMLFGRFIATSILHLSLIDEVSAGLEFMKFTLNHDYLFQNYATTWFVGLFQYTSALGVEIASIGVICTALDPISIVFNFIALAIIAEFDNYVYSSMKNESMKELIEKKFVKRVLVIKHTTSKKCKEDEFTDSKDQDGN